MRLFFGRAHSTYRLIDDEFYGCMILNNYDLKTSLLALKSVLLKQYNGVNVHTINPLLLKYGILDEYIHYIDNDGKEIRVIDTQYYKELNKQYNMEFFIMNNSEVWPSDSAKIVLGDWTTK